MDFDDFAKLTGFEFKDIERLNTKLEEVKKLYDIGEAEFQLIQQMSMLIKVGMGLSPKLQVKLVKAYAAMSEIIVEELGRMKK